MVKLGSAFFHPCPFCHGVVIGRTTNSNDDRRKSRISYQNNCLHTIIQYLELNGLQTNWRKYFQTTTFV